MCSTRLTPEMIRNSIIKLALEGKLVSNTTLSVKDYLSECECQSNIKHTKIIAPPFEIPSNWEWVYLPEIVDFKLGKTPPRDEAQWWGEDINWFSIADMLEKQVIYESKEKVSNDAILSKFGSISKKGTLLMSFKLTVGRTSILGVDGVHNEAIISIFPYVSKENITRDFLMYTLEFLTHFIEKTGAIKGLTLNKEKLKKLMIPLPPLDVQKRLVNKLKEIDSVLDEYCEVEEELSALEESIVDKMTKSVLLAIISGKERVLISNENNEEYFNEIKQEMFYKKENTLFDKGDSISNYTKYIPSNWIKCYLKDIAYIYGGKRIPAGEKFSIEPTNHRYLRVTDMKNHTIIGNAYISDDIYEKIKNYHITQDDLYITVAGTIGEVGEIPQEYNMCNLTENANKIVVSKLINKKWLMYYLMSELTQKQIREFITKVGQPKLAINKIQSLTIYIPPRKEQDAMVELIDNVFNECNNYKNRGV